jgi:RNA polymerase sigma factor (sigma-70 family)
MTQATPSATSPGIGAARLLSDDQLARRATKGDERAFSAIFRRYHQDLYRYCTAIVGNSEDAHDALQNTMVKVLRALPGEQRRIQLKPWLYRIAHNESIELLRQRRPTEPIELDVVAVGPELATEAETRERLRRLLADMEELPDRQRGALVMRELSGLGFDQIGAAFETSPAVARQTVYEARLGLQQMSEGREMLCEEVCRTLSDGDGRVGRRRDIRAHLRACPACREFREGVTARQRDFAAIAPLPAAAAAGLLHGILGGAHGATGAGLGGGAGLSGATGAGAAGKALAGSALVKSATTVAVVAVVGVSAADRSGLIHVLPESGNRQQREVQSSPGGSDQGVPASGQGAGAVGGAASLGGAARRGARRAGKGSGRADAQGGRAGDNGVSSPASGANGHGNGRDGSTASAHGKETSAAHSAAGHSHQSQHPTSSSHPGTKNASKGSSKKTGGAAHSGHAAHASHPSHPSHAHQSPSHYKPPPASPSPPQAKTSPERRAPDQSASTAEQLTEP